MVAQDLHLLYTTYNDVEQGAHLEPYHYSKISVPHFSHKILGPKKKQKRQNETTVTSEPLNLIKALHGLIEF